MTFQHATYETAEVGMGVALTTHPVGPPQDQNSELGINEMKIKKKNLNPNESSLYP